jgi:hypothetical protein
VPTGDRVVLRPFRPADVEPLRQARLDPLTWASKARALRTYRAVGVVEEGRLREHAWVEGAHDDVVLMAVFRSEWQVDLTRE